MDKHSSLLWKFINYDRKKFYNVGPSTLVAMGSSTVAAAVVDADVVDADAVLSLDDSGGEWSEIVDHLLEIYDLSSVQMSVCEV